LSDKFEKTFSKEQFELFNDWNFKDTNYSGLVQEKTYINGFKTGMLLILEILGFNLV